MSTITPQSEIQLTLRLMFPTLFFVSLVTFRFEKWIFGLGDVPSRFGGMSISKGNGNLSLLFHQCIGKSKPKTKAQKNLIMKNMGLRKQLLKNGGILHINSTVNMIQLSIVMHV